MSQIIFHDHLTHSHLKNRSTLKKFLRDLFVVEKKQLDRVNFIFCTDNFLLALNQEFLKHDYFTDTMTFLYSEKTKPIKGEVYISIDRIKSNAEKFKIPFQTELLSILIHGCLHLCGYEDKSTASKKKMALLQEKYLAKWFVSRET